MIGNLVCARFRFELETLSPIRLEAFAGSTLRGAFGHVFKRAVCVWPPADCPRCLLRHTCPYPYVFESSPPPDAERLRGIDQIPRPFVIEPPTGANRCFAPGERFSFTVILIGRGLEYVSHFYSAFRRLGEMGLGPARGRYRIAGAAFQHSESRESGAWAKQIAESLPSIPLEQLAARGSGEPGSKCFSIAFQTPTRIRIQGTMQCRVTFQDLVRALLRRLSSLSYFHCGGELDIDFRGLIERAATVRTRATKLHWQDQQRISGRQRQAIEMGGIVGRVEFEAPTVEFLMPFWPLLRAGEWVHVGKGCVMGLGKFEVLSANQDERHDV